MTINLKINNTKTIDVQDWDNFITNTYWKTYSFQQQDWCKDRWMESFYASKTKWDSYNNDSIPFKVNWSIMGVSLDAWLKMDKETVRTNLPADEKKDYCIDLFFERNFYPHIEELANDLCKKWLLEEWEYAIEIDW